MRVAVLVYVLLYLAVEVLGSHVAALRWELVTPLMLATAGADAMLVVAVLVAALVLTDLTRRRWRPALHAWLNGHGRRQTGRRDAHRHHDVVGVPSWRAGTTARPAVQPAGRPTATFADPTYAVGGGPARPGRRFPEDDGTLL